MTDTFAVEDLEEDILGPEADSEPSEDVPGTGQIDTSFFEAPDFADFIKKPRSAAARDYEKRTASLLKTVAFARMQSPGGLPDAATLIYHGPKFASAAGMLAAEDKHAAKMIDLITSPENPYVMFAIAGIPLVAQLLRNHEAELAEARKHVKMTRAQRKAAAAGKPKPVAEITIPVIKKKIKVKLPFRIKFEFFRGQSVEPAAIVNSVFSDPRVRRELRKQGINIGE